MVLRKTIEDREHDKFTTWDSGETAVRTVSTGEFVFSGLSIAGRITEVTLSSTAWTPLPATPLADRNSIAIQNVGGVEIKLNYDNTESGYVGVKVPADAERQYDITESIIIYAKAQSGTPTITVEELS